MSHPQLAEAKAIVHWHLFADKESTEKPNNLELEQAQEIVLKFDEYRGVEYL